MKSLEKILPEPAQVCRDCGRERELLRALNAPRPLLTQRRTKDGEPEARYCGLCRPD